ncbi:MAG: divalent-cation tolerance protein CutA [Candidatus Omnitrophica bacterium]|nr:divalent-cation tolerance protein CutA [Candidatus Omnitrophota bacterium]
MYVVIFITAAQKTEATRIAKALLKSKLAACVNIVDKVESFFWWQGKIDRAKEYLLIAKSVKANLPKVCRLVKSLHSYAVPEIIGVPIAGGSKTYLNWINDSIR